MWQTLGWTALAAGAISLILALRALGRAESGPYGDVMPPGMRGVVRSLEW